MSTDLSFGDMENSQRIQGVTGDDDLYEQETTSHKLATNNDLNDPGVLAENVVGEVKISTAPTTESPNVPKADQKVGRNSEGEPEVVTIFDDKKDQKDEGSNVATGSTIRKRPSVKTVNLPKDFGSQLATLATKQQEVLDALAGLESRLAFVEEKMDVYGADQRSLLEVHKNGLEQIRTKIDRLAQNTRNVEREMIKANSCRIETSLDLIGIKLDGVCSTLNDVEGSVNACKLSTEITKDGLDSLRLLDARLSSMEAKLGKDGVKEPKQTALWSAQIDVSSPCVTSEAKIMDASLLRDSKRKASSTLPEPTSAKTPKRSRPAAPFRQDDASKKTTFPIGLHEYDSEKNFTFACRYALIKSSNKGIKFDRKCLFTTSHLSLMVSHRNFHGNHGPYLLDGITQDVDHRKDGKDFVCTKTTLAGTECAWRHGQLGQFNRHSRKFLHREDIFILHRTCIPCGTSFYSDDELLNHVTTTKCEVAKGQFGVDSRDLSASGLTCRICGMTDFIDGNAVFAHQGTNACKPGSEKLELEVCM